MNNSFYRHWMYGEERDTPSQVRPEPSFAIGQRVQLSQEVRSEIQHYSPRYQELVGIPLIIEDWYNHDGDGEHGHPGFDPVGSGETECLYAVRREDGHEVLLCFYDFELDSLEEEGG